MKIVIIGAGGRLGGALARYFRDRHEVVAFGRKALDLAWPEMIDDRLLPIEFDVVVNAAALTSVDACEARKEEAYEVNAAGPGRVADLCAHRESRMVLVSTDYVYEGSAKGRKTEESPTDPLGVYAKTKLAGEEEVLEASDRHLVLRTAWVFGPDRPSFVDSILKRAATTPEIAAIDDKFSSPIYSADFGPHLELLLERKASGVINVCNDGACSWREFGAEALEIGRSLGLPSRASSLGAQKLADMSAFVAQRPVHTAMSVEKLARVTGQRPRSWEEALRDYLETFYVKA